MFGVFLMVAATIVAVAVITGVVIVICYCMDGSDE